jgi:hypothetical protein
VWEGTLKTDYLIKPYSWPMICEILGKQPHASKARNPNILPSSIDQINPVAKSEKMAALHNSCRDCWDWLRYEAWTQPSGSTKGPIAFKTTAGIFPTIKRLNVIREPGG